MTPRLCEWCQERFALEGIHTCDLCQIHDEDRDCPACGSELNYDGSCLCDFGSNPDDTQWWKRLAS